jgi:hypothetical protein
LDQNYVSTGQFFPYGGMTPGQMATAGGTQAETPQNSSGVPSSPEYSGIGNPLMWVVVLAIMLVALMFGARAIGERGGGDGAAKQFYYIKPSGYNLLVIALASIIGGSVLKTAAYRVKNWPLLGGPATVVLAS